MPEQNFALRFTPEAMARLRERLFLHWLMTPIKPTNRAERRAAAQENRQFTTRLRTAFRDIQAKRSHRAWRAEHRRPV